MLAILEGLTSNQLLLFIVLPLLIVSPAFSHFYSSERRRMQDMEATLKRMEKKLEILMQHAPLTTEDKQILREIDKLFS